MSEKKRFEFYSDDYLVGIIDTATGKKLNHFATIDLLNEQQATIQFLQNEIDELKKDIDIYKYEEKKHSETARKLYEENEQLKEELNNLKKDETMLYHYYTLARYGGD